MKIQTAKPNTAILLASAPPPGTPELSAHTPQVPAGPDTRGPAPRAAQASPDPHGAQASSPQRGTQVPTHTTSWTKRQMQLTGHDARRWARALHGSRCHGDKSTQDTHKNVQESGLHVGPTSNAGLKLPTMRSRPELRSRAQHLSHQTIMSPYYGTFLKREYKD